MFYDFLLRSIAIIWWLEGIWYKTNNKIGKYLGNIGYVM